MLGSNVRSGQKRSGWVGAGCVSAESAFEGWRVGVEFVALPVDCDMVMEPAQHRKVRNVVASTACPPCDVVWLEPIPRPASRLDSLTPRGL